MAALTAARPEAESPCESIGVRIWLVIWLVIWPVRLTNPAAILVPHTPTPITSPSPLETYDISSFLHATRRAVNSIYAVAIGLDPLNA